MNYVNATIQADAPPAVGVDGVLAGLRTRLETLPWLDRVFGRAFDVTTPDVRTVPGIYAGKGESYNALPSDNLTSCAFFRAKGPEQRDTDKPSRTARSQRATRVVSCIVWANLQRLDHPARRDYPYHQTLIDEVVKVLSRASDVVEIEEIADEGAREVFENYDLTPAERLYTRYPHAAFRVDLTVFYRPTC